MDVVVSESTILTALHEGGLAGELLSSGHHFLVADLFLHHREIDADVTDSLFASGLTLKELSPGDMSRLKELRREHAAICIGNLASLVLSEVHHCPILAGNTGLGTLSAVADRGLLALSWVMDQLEGRVATDRLRHCLEAIAANHYYRHHLHSPEIAVRLQRYSTGASSIAENSGR